MARNSCLLEGGLGSGLPSGALPTAERGAVRSCSANWLARRAALKSREQDHQQRGELGGRTVSSGGGAAEELRQGIVGASQVVRAVPQRVAAPVVGWVAGSGR